MSSTSSSPSTQTDLENLDADARYHVLGDTTEPTDIPNFISKHTEHQSSRTHVDYEKCILEMAEWLDDHINAGEVHSPYNNDDYHGVSTRMDIRHYEFSESPVLPNPNTMDSDGSHCIRVDLKGTVEPRTRYEDPEPKKEAYQQLWNFVSIFADITGAEIKTQYSSNPRDDFNVYLFYSF